MTFLFTDVEGSTARWEQHPEEMRVALARHDHVLREAIVEHGGHVVKTMGDAFHAAFSRAPDAVAAALDGQRRLLAETWGEIGPLRVRMALHTGAAEERDGDYYGPPLNRAARLLSAGHGGQVLLSQLTYELVRDTPPEGASLVDLGEHRLKDLIRPERVFQVQHRGLPAEFPPLVSLDARPHNLPVQVTPLLGREQDVRAVQALLLRDEVRLATLTGPGGTGKTRLGLQVAAELLDRFAGGVFVVELAPITDPGLVPSTIAQALGVRDVGGRPLLDAIVDYLRNRQLLLLLDNFEQVLDAATVVTALLHACSELSVLVTSRTPLQVGGEHEFPVPPLALPEVGRAVTAERLSEYAAVALFVERATAVKPDFAVTAANAPTIAEICHRLDGLPLAIELAAARMRLLAPEAMLPRLSRGLGLLAGGRRDVPARQQSLRNAIAWSYDLLSEPEQRLFRRLGVFVGGFTLEAVEAVCGGEAGLEFDVLAGVESLVLKSLLRQEEGVAAEPRFAMLETIREYALEQLATCDDADTLRQYHAQDFLALAENAAPNLEGDEQIVWLDRLDADHSNLRAALTWSRSAGDFETGLRIARALTWFWNFRGYVGEGRAWLASALEAPSDRVTPVTRARALTAANELSMVTGDVEASRRYGEEAVRIARELGDPRTLGRALATLASSTFYDDPATARSYYEEAIPILRAVGDTWGLAYAIGPRGAEARAAGKYAAAYAHHMEGAALSRQVGDRRGIGLALIGAAFASRLQGDQVRAVSLYREALVPLRELGHRWMLARALEGLAAVYCLQGDHGRAARLYGASEALRETIGAPVNPAHRADYGCRVADSRAALGEEAFAAAWADGRAMTLEQAVAYALDGQESA